MDSFIRFLLRFKSLLLFLILEAVAVVLMVNTNSYHHYVFFSSANVVTGNLGGFVGGISDYFGLRGANEELLRQNMVLMEQVRDLQTRNNMLEQAISQDSLPVLPLAVDTTLSPDRNFRFIEAKILNLTVNRRLNYITLNKGARDGVSDNMGVICSDGVVGTVAMVSEKFSLVLPVINLQSKTSCRLDSCEYLGSLVWDGQDPLYAGLEEIPRHADVKVGDKVCTSGFSDIFPIGIPVGTVSEAEVTDADNFYSIKVRLSADFQRLTGVYVVAFEDNAELMQLTDSVSTLNAHGR
ncbi:MAG: rod shape-determining protein MreC [Bacteroidetes bacterium]|uniref:Cell shape-determining protein MreC n=1 Tax=Candidatus Enterocola intestinipullorum TaxID=2840783 RepID=A0A9D9EGD1_9BACT|nr:rod shape-determining protein MreC [Candidatus Enterocola intestinipullorum]